MVKRKAMQPSAAASGMPTGGGYSSQGVRGVRGGQDYDPDDQMVFGVNLARAERASLPVSPPQSADSISSHAPVPPLRAISEDPIQARRAHSLQ